MAYTKVEKKKQKKKMNGMGTSHTNCTLGAWTRWHLQGNEIENKREIEWKNGT